MLNSIGRGRRNCDALLSFLAKFSVEVYKALGLSSYFFIVTHALTGLYHHYVVKDDTLKRMLPRSF